MTKETELKISEAVENTDVLLWIKDLKDDNSPRIHVTENGGIGIDVGGHVIVMTIEKWHTLGKLRAVLRELGEP